MGKKKSKAGKQRQAKAKSLQSKKLQFHVPISKDGQLLPQHANGSFTLDKNSRQNKSEKLHKVSASNSKSTKKTLNKWKSEEDLAFEHEYKSLQERQYHAQINKAAYKQKKDIPLAPATFQLKMDHIPTAEELIQDAAQKLDGLMSSSNTTTTTTTTTIPVSSHHSTDHKNILQVLAAQKRQESYMISNNVRKEENKFWALQQDDDDSDEDTLQDNSKSISMKHIPLFQFAAPSFSLPSTYQNEVDNDPDL